jgi:hypothetical protein
MAFVWPLRHKRNNCPRLAGATLAKVAEPDGFSLNNRTIIETKQEQQVRARDSDRMRLAVA